MTILKLDWHLDNNQSPSELPNFESLARKMRYRALGKACRCFRISSLLLAHHKDDQAETVLLRLNAGYTGTGLAGIQQKAAIPECAGIYGVHASGGSPSSPSSSLSSNDRGEGVDMRVATGGVELVRPLLDFSKVSLIKYCHKNGVSWVEDATNRDVTLTTRNAIRSLLKNKRLPQALNKPALLRLADAKEEYNDTTKRLADEAFEQVEASINYGTGTLRFTISESISNMLNQNTALMLLRRLASCVSPQDNVSKAQLASACEQVFPDTTAMERTLQGQGKRMFTVADVSWHGRTFEDDPTTWQWHLSRQRPSKPFPVCEWTSETLVYTAAHPYWTWQLFDGRYWVRARHAKKHNVSLQMLRPETLEVTRKFKHRVLILDRLLHEHAPGLLRFTLPAFADQETGRVLALPTLGWRADHDHGLEWEIQYKQLI